MTSSSTNDTYKKLLTLKFDQITNDLYDTSNMYDTKIKSNESLITEYNNMYLAQNLKNNILKTWTLSFFIIFIAVFLYYSNVINSHMVLLIIIVAIIVLTMLITYFLYYTYDYDAYLDRISKNTAKSLESGKSPIGNELTCENIEDEDINIDLDDKNLVSKSLQNNYDKSLNATTNSNYNVWLNGDHVSDKSINENNYVNVDLDQSNYRYVDSNNSTDVVGKFNKISPEGATYYDCKYVGANHNGMPLKNEYIKSTIPCSYYVDYKETGKYLMENGKYVSLYS